MSDTLPTKKKTVHINRADERDYIERYQRLGDNDALQVLLDVHNPYVQHLAAKAFRQFNKVVEFEDLVQQARMGLIKAAQQFDLEKKVEDPESANFGESLRFLTYAHRWMIAQMQDAWHHAHAVHIPAHTLRAIHFKKIEEKTTLSPKAKDRMKLAKLAMKSESLDALKDAGVRNKENRTSNIFEIQFNDNGVRMMDPTFDEGIANVYSPEVQKVIDKLDPVEWQVLKYRLGIEEPKYPVPEIAKRLNLTTDEVDRLFKRAKRIMSKQLGTNKR